jgi:3-aminobutyryl-CoA ammonia-lyase
MNVRSLTDGPLALVETAVLRVRMGGGDAHYGGMLVAGATLVRILGDVATELCIRADGDEGLLRAYEELEFLVPVKVGDYLEASATLVERGRTSRAIDFEIHKVIELDPEISPTAARVLDAPVLVCRARGTVVIPKERQRSPS